MPTHTESEYWLNKLSNLRQARDNAPHKPLFLLSLLEMIEVDGDLPQSLVLGPKLDFRFRAFEHVVAHRRTQRLDIRMPFHHLQTSGLWTSLTKDESKSEHYSMTRSVKIDDGFLEVCQDCEFRRSARILILDRYFEPREQITLREMLKMDDRPIEDIQWTSDVDVYEATESGRSGRFRLDVVPTYNYTCALTGYSMNAVGGASIVDAAHIHQFAESGNNDLRNGLALSKNAHWMFDEGLWSIDDDFRIIVAEGMFSEAAPLQTSLVEFSGRRLFLPRHEQLWPEQKHIRWHRRHRFVGG